MSWTEQAACKRVDPEVFFPVATEGTEAFAEQVAPALAVCGRCPVRRECLTLALEVGAVGVWGGTTEGERRNMARRLVDA